MPHFDPAASGSLLAGLIPQELRQAGGLVTYARKRAGAVLEIDARANAGGPAASCPRCGSDARYSQSDDLRKFVAAEFGAGNSGVRIAQTRDAVFQKFQYVQGSSTVQAKAIDILR